MKIRIFKKLQNGVFDVRVQTEDWSENDRNLMIKYGEPEINLGGEFVPDDNSSGSSISFASSESSASEIVIPTSYARVMTESPFTHKFDARDCGSVANAQSVAQQWAQRLEARITTVVSELREKNDIFTTEEITEI